MTLQDPLRPVRQAVRTHPLQQVVAPKPWAPSLLYFDSASAPLRADGEGPMMLVAGQQIIADGYFNCFYLAWWIAHTNVRNVGIRCRTTGSLVLRVIGHLANGDCVTLLERHVQGEDPDSDAPLWVWDRDAHGEVVRLHVEAKALGDCSIDEICFVTHSPPLNGVSLSIGLCTFNREGLLAETMAELVPLLTSCPLVRRIILVNQGQSFSDPKLRALCNAPGVEVILQPNRGGSGGFTRGMIETLDAEAPVTHHLVMDDDIKLDARILRRAILFLGHCTGEIALGGQSIELEDRTRLHEAGAIVGRDWLHRSFGKAEPLAERKSLGLWDKSFACDYNGWWFCIFPVAALRKAGLPAPFFLHNDDVEHGLRLKAAGVPTVPLPGLGVWHSSFLYKHAGVLSYYDLRNMLIMAAFHPEVAPRPGILSVLGWIMSSLLVHRYRAALACLIAVEDYLAGPEATFATDSGTRNGQVRDLVHAHPAPDLRTGVKADKLVLLKPRAPGKSTAWQVAAFAAIFLRIILLPVRQEPDLLVRGTPQPMAVWGRSYLLALDPAASRCFHLRPRRLTLIRMTLRALILALRYGVGGKRAAASWQAAMPGLCSRKRWAQEFGQDRA
jgi:galactofuranosylgalactofuranosylrhamnosyl-N-acetylglucosaminyl-diphospho-decaprenol beta-1,5/1,6-galactofuranosyltransferase